MTEGNTGKASMTFWLIGGAALIWNLFGLMVYISQVTATPEGLEAAGYTAEQIAFMEQTPEWVTSVFAIAVNAGVLGCILLLLRKAWAVPVFALSLVAVLVQNAHGLLMTDMIALFGTVPVFIQLAVIVIAIALLLYSRSLKAKGTLS